MALALTEEVEPLPQRALLFSIGFVEVVEMRGRQQNDRDRDRDCDRWRMMVEAEVVLEHGPNDLDEGWEKMNRKQIGFAIVAVLVRAHLEAEAAMEVRRVDMIR